MKVPDQSSAETSDSNSIRVYKEGDNEISQVETNRGRAIHLSRMAERQQNSRQADECLELLLPIVAANPDDVDALLAVGTAYWVHGQLREAERYWDRVLMINPQNERALANLAIICHEAEAFGEGLAYLDALIEVNPWRPELYGRRTHMLGRVGRLQEGVDSAKKVLELDPGIAQMHGWLAEAYDLLNQTDLAQKHRQIHRRMTNAK